MSSTQYADQVAKIILDAEAFMLTPKKPFKLTSGLFSPFYIDCRKIISHAKGRKQVGDFLADAITQTIKGKFDIVAGGVTAGVPFATMVAERLEMPLVYIRPEPKAHGKGQQIEGGDVSGKRVLLIEDLVTKGSSQVKFAEAIRTAGGTLTHASVVFSRANDATLKELKDIGIDLIYLCHFNDLLKFVESSGTYADADVAEAKAFLANPEAWSAKNQPSAA